MGHQYAPNENMPKWDRLNKFTNATVPISGNIVGNVSASVYLSGSSVRCGPLIHNAIYEIVSPQNYHSLAYSEGLAQGSATASVSSSYWSADLPRYHIVRSGSSDYISFVGHDTSIIEVTINVAENLDIPGR